MADGRIIIDTAIDNRGFERGVASMKKGTNSLKNALDGLTKAIGVAFSAVALVSFGKKAVELGSSIAEVQNVVDTAFGRMSYKVEEFANSAIQNFGMSRLAAKQTASTYMAMARGMGQGLELASDKAVELTGRLGDIASFYNKTQSEVDTIGRAVYSGETEPLKQIGIVMTQNNLELFAMRQGYWQLYKDMSAADQLLVRQEFFLNATKLAAGDFVKTQDSWANQTRILSMQWQEFMSIVGDTLITVLHPVLKTLNEMVASMIEAAQAVNEIVTALFGGQQIQNSIQDGAGQTQESIEGSVDGQEALTDAMKETEKEQKKTMAGFDQINKLAGEISSTNSGNSTGDVKPDGTKDDVTKIEGVASRLQGVIEALRQGFAEIASFARSVWSAFSESWSLNGQTVMAAARNAFDGILKLIGSIATAFSEVWTNGSGVDALNTVYSILGGMMDAVSALADRIREAWAASGNGVAIWQSLMNMVQMVLSFVDRVVSATVEWARGLNLEPIVSSFRRLMEAVEPLVTLFLDGLAWAYENVLLPLATWVIEDAAPAGVDLLSAALGALQAVIEAVQPFAIWLWENFMKPIGQWTGEIVINAIHWLTEKLNAFSAWARDNPEKIQKAAETIFSLLAGIVLYYTTKKIVDIVGAIKLAFEGLAGGFSMAKVQAGLAVIAFAAIVDAIMDLVKNWDKMNGLEKVIAVIAAVGAAALAAALAVGAFQSALTMGLAVAGIVAGIVAITAAINSAKSRVDSMSRGGNFGLSGGGFSGGGISALSAYNIPALATGAVIPPNREFLAVLGDQRSGTNIEAPMSTIKQGLREVLAETDGAMPQEITLRLVAESGFVRGLKLELDAESQRRGVKLIRGTT